MEYCDEFVKDADRSGSFLFSDEQILKRKKQRKITKKIYAEVLAKNKENTRKRRERDALELAEIRKRNAAYTQSQAEREEIDRIAREIAELDNKNREARLSPFARNILTMLRAPGVRWTIPGMAAVLNVETPYIQSALDELVRAKILKVVNV